MFSKTCEYALRAIIYISQQSLQGEKANINEISREIKSPKPFTAKIVQQFSKKKIIESTKGPNGGYFISKEKMKTLRMVQIICMFEGDDIFNKCVLGFEKCSGQNPCSFHEKYVPIREQIHEAIEHCTLFDVVNENQNLFHH